MGVLRTNASATSLQDGASSAGSRPASRGGAADEDDASWRDCPDVVALASFGYPPEHAMAALEACRGRLLGALHLLQQQLLAGRAQQHGGSDADDDGAVYAGTAAPPEAWAEEVEVLGAIYGDDLADGGSDGDGSSGHVALSLPLLEQQVRAG